MSTWKKLGRVFDPHTVNDRPWLQQFAQAPSVIVFEDFVRVYFSTRPLPDSRGQYCSFSGYVDLSRGNLMNILRVSDEPVLALGGLGEFDEFGTYPVSVASDGESFVAYYAGWTRCESVPFNVGIGMARSTNGGVSFEKVGKGPVLPYSVDEPFILSGPKIRKFGDKWQLWYIAGSKWIVADGKPEPVYKIRMASSDDGIHWIKQNRNLIPSKVEDDEAQASPDVFYKNGCYHMFFSYRYSSDYRGKEHGYRIGYASSDDMYNWVRDDSKAGIDVSATGWDSEMVAYPHVFELDGEIYMLYLGNQVGKHGFGLAKLEGAI